MKLSINLARRIAGIFLILTSGMVIATLVSDAKTTNASGQLSHPVLQSDRNFFNSKLTVAGHRKMINLLVRSSERNSWASKFGELEAESGSDLCRSLKGRTKKEISAWLGFPAFKMGSDLCFPKSYDPDRALAILHREIRPPFDNLDDNWLYFYGGRPLLLRVYFRGEECIAAMMAGYEDDALYNIWRFEDLNRRAVGSSIKVLVEREGPPDTETDKSHERVQLESDAATAAILRAADNVIYYQFGDFIGVALAIKNNRCVFICPCKTLRGTFGKKDFSHESYQAGFRMPS